MGDDSSEIDAAIQLGLVIAAQVRARRPEISLREGPSRDSVCDQVLHYALGAKLRESRSLARLLVARDLEGGVIDDDRLGDRVEERKGVAADHGRVSLERNEIVDAEGTVRHPALRVVRATVFVLVSVLGFWLVGAFVDTVRDTVMVSIRPSTGAPRCFFETDGP
jgi:hypothetical protein